MSKIDGNYVEEIYPPFNTSNKATTEALIEYTTNYAQSIKEPETFWLGQAKKYLTWFTDPVQVTSGSFIEGDISWFAGGKLNVAYNCIDRHLPERADQVC